MSVVAGIRVSDLAKEVNQTPQELVKALADLGITVKGANAVLDQETASTVRALMEEPPVEQKVVEINPDATLKDLAEAMKIQSSAAVKKMMEFGKLIAPHQRISRADAEQLATAYGYRITIKVEQKPTAAHHAKHKAPGGALQTRPPVVTIMGHVDHGKTSLLDTIRKTNVVSGEFGGITQHIGAYQVEVEHNGEKRRITFLDTPGHAAFTEMRARGASVTDIVILVVAADDGIMPQTVEAINHARAAEVPIIVAINKIDKPDARPDRIKQQLTEHHLVVEEYGGDVIAVPVSAKTQEGIPDLLEYILLVADVHEYKADAHGHATGAIVEAKVEPGRGSVATVLVQSGTLRIGDSIVAGLAYGNIRAMTNERGERIQKAGPATPVEIQGLNATPAAGDHVEVVKNEKEGRQIAEKRQQKARNSRLSGPVKRLTLAEIARQAQEGISKELSVIVKGDVQGSVEAIIGQFGKIEEEHKDEDVHITVKLSGVGSISESDISLAVATGSIVIGFNVRADAAGQRAAERDGVDVRLYNIIYDLTEDIERALKGLFEPVYEEIVLGKAEVRQRFQTPRGVVIAGSYVLDGLIRRNAEVRVIRNKETIATSKFDSLRRIKDDVREVAQGYECGIVVQDFSDVQVGDILECFEMREVER
jgi:translation initiation factor IF-2